MQTLIALKDVATELQLSRKRIHVLVHRKGERLLRAVNGKVERDELERFKQLDRPTGRPLGVKDRVARKRRQG